MKICSLVYLDKFGSNVLEFALEIDGFSDGHAVLCDLGAAPALFNDHVTALEVENKCALNPLGSNSIKISLYKSTL